MRYANPPSSPFTKGGNTFLLPLAKGGAAVQSLITHASEALGLWRRTVGRDLNYGLTFFSSNSFSVVMRNGFLWASTHSYVFPMKIALTGQASSQ